MSIGGGASPTCPIPGDSTEATGSCAGAGAGATYAGAGRYTATGWGCTPTTQPVIAEKTKRHKKSTKYFFIFASFRLLKGYYFPTGGRPPASFEFFLKKEYQKNMNP
jgi:hypothetical protein